MKPPCLANLARDVQGARSDKTGIQGIFEVDEVAMIACPDLMRVYQEGLMDLDQIHGVMELMVSLCENSFPGPAYRMAVLDAPQSNRAKMKIVPCRPNSKNRRMCLTGCVNSIGDRS